MAVRETRLARGVHGGLLDWHVSERDGAWRRVERMLVRQKIQAARVGACDVFSGCSWLGFAWGCLFCHSMPLLLQLDEQNDEIRELLDLWA